MLFQNNATLVRRELLTHIVKLLCDGELEAKIDRIPLELRPRTNSPIRCCVHKDRAVLKYKIMAILGFNIQDEEDELTPLSDYVRMAVERKQVSEQVLTVVDEACSACRNSNYIVTNMCRACDGRACMLNCPKDAIEMKDGQAVIDPKACINCGKCLNVCPFHAIIYAPVPCENACPVDAISKNENGIEQIDNEKCINCGKCLDTCPFGAIMEKSHLVEIILAMLDKKEIIALPAPAVAGQLKAEMSQIHTALSECGFDYIYDVAEGADETTINEAKELAERLEDGAPFMTTSCCPSYTSMVKKHLPELAPFVSHTPTPMHFTAKKAREEHPDAVLIFIAPCAAKRNEAFHDPYVDYVMNVEEMGAFFIAHEIDVNKCEPAALRSSTKEAKLFAVSGGVTDAVLSRAGDLKVDPVIINGLDKKTIKELKRWTKTGAPGNFIEVMSCEGGCVGGCNVVAKPNIAKRQLQQGSQNT